ncbi:MAG: hypothetical protein ABSG80_01740 [Verrucomicrobiota bacterium]|jgi:hypothetical protein
MNIKPLRNLIKSIKGVTTLAVLLISIICSSGKLFFSAATNDVYIGVAENGIVNFTNADWVTNNMPIRYDDKLAIIAFCNTGAVRLLIPWDKTIFVKVQMRDATGNEIVKTAVGRLWGSDVERFPRKPGMNNHDRMASWGATGSHTNGFSAFTTGYSLPAPKDLFVITNSGIYDLTLEVHLMKQRMLGMTNALGTPTWTWDHITIPPVTVRVEKPPEGKANLLLNTQTNSPTK